MRALEIAVGSAVERIKDTELRRQSFGGVIRRLKPNLKLGSENMFHRIEPQELNGKIGAVDGGLLQRSFHGLDLVLGKAVGVVFDYRGSRLMSADYFPEAFPTPSPFPILGALSSRDSEILASIYRQKLEMSTATKLVEKFKPKAMLLDGSVIPHGNTRPYDDSEIKDEYRNLIEIYKGLFEACTSNDVTLAGIVEDSRGKRFGEILLGCLDKNTRDENVLLNTRDTNLLYYILDQGERTCSFPFSKDPKRHPILKEFNKWSAQVRTFYLRAAAYDRPLRIDFLTGDADDIAGMLLPLCQTNELYGIPAPVIEADARAKLHINEMEIAYNQICDKVGDLACLMKLRRDLRPF